MMKPIYGRSGIGIAMVEQRDTGIIVRTGSDEMPLADFRLEYPVFLQEVLRQDPRIGAIWNSSVNTLRIVTMLTARGDVIILGCTMRFGVGKSIVDNWTPAACPRASTRKPADSGNTPATYSAICTRSIPRLNSPSKVFKFPSGNASSMPPADSAGNSTLQNRRAGSLPR